MPDTWEYKYSSMIADHLSTCGGLNRLAIVADGSALCWPLGSSVRFVGMDAACTRAEPVGDGDQQSERPLRPTMLTRKAPCSGNAAGTPAPRAPAVLRAWLTALTQDAVKLPYTRSEDWPWRRGKEDP